MFEHLNTAPPDAILGLTEAFNNDTNPAKINLSVGVFKDAAGVTPILNCVKEAERRLLDDEKTKGYLSIAGTAEYGRHVRELLFGAGHSIVQENRAATVQTPGGTGALRVAGDFIRRKFPNSRIWCSKPTWANHPNVFAAAGVDVQQYDYLNAGKNGLDFDAMMDSLRQIPAGDVVLLHACCHNPTGVDPDPDQWKQIAEVVKKGNLLPLVDFAYQGFGRGLMEDREGLSQVCQLADEMLICSSFSKNFGLYGERVGAMTLVARSAEAAAAGLSHVKVCVRSNYSNPPRHGGAIVTAVLDDPALRASWEQELGAMRDRIRGMRELFVRKLDEKGIDRDFSHITQQTGMFSFSGLTPMQVDRLRNEFSIYIVGSGRINVAGMTESNMDRLCEAIKTVS